MFKKYLIVSLMILSAEVFAKYDLRRCLILPVTGTKDLTFSNQVFEETEDYLKDVKWCYYTPNSEIMDILTKYRDNLDEYLEKKEVLQLVAEKTKTGALVRIQLLPQNVGVLVKFRVMGESGEDFYSKDEKLFPENDPDSIGESISKWLEDYAKKIPFDAQIESVNEKTFIADMGSNIGFDKDMEAKIVHPLDKKIHPLFKEVIGWDMKDLGDGKFDNVEDENSTGTIISLISETKPVQGDWLIKKGPLKEAQPKEKKGSPKYGYVSLALDLGNANQTAESYNFSNEYTGFMLGGYLKGEIWFLEHLWSSLELDGRFGDLKGDYYPQNDSEKRTFFKFKAGYRFLLSESFFGPQIDVYLGYGGYSYQPDVVYLQGPVDATFNGLIFGAKGNFPISEKIRAFLEAEMIFANGKSAQYNGGTTPGYSLFIGGNYFFAPKWSADLSLGGYNNTFENIVPGENVVYKDYSLRLGASLYF
jgi:hypothetical protein